MAIRLTSLRIPICLSLLCTVSACEVSPSTLRDLGDARLSFECPNNVSVVKRRIDGQTFRIGYHGPVEGDPDECVMDTPGSRRTHTTVPWFFGYVEQTGETAEEHLVLRQQFGDFMHGRTEKASFIMRGNGQQLVQQFGLLGRETLGIDGHPIETIKMRRRVIDSADGKSSYIDLWYDTADHLFVRAQASPDYPVSRQIYLSWTVIAINQVAKDPS